MNQLMRLTMPYDNEAALVEDIKKLVLKDAQAKWLHEKKLSIEDVLNGRFRTDLMAGVEIMFIDWNLQLGKEVFKF